VLSHRSKVFNDSICDVRARLSGIYGVPIAINALGEIRYLIIGIFALSWLASIVIYKVRGSDEFVTGFRIIEPLQDNENGSTRRKSRTGIFQRFHQRKMRVHALPSGSEKRIQLHVLLLPAGVSEMRRRLQDFYRQKRKSPQGLQRLQTAA
jgi:hypothetical protein